MSETFTLVVLDISGIQRYVFGSNVLVHSLGASELVHAATHSWVRTALPQPHNFRDDDTLEATRSIEDRGDGALAAEVIYVGGGNAVIVFADKDAAIQLNRTLSHQVLTEAAGLNLVIALKEFEWGAEPLGKTVADMLAVDIQRKKNAGLPNTGLLGLGVTASCDFTGLPATGKDSDGRRISSEVACKVAAEKTANQRLEREIKSDYAFLFDFNKIGDHGTFSHMAVAHTDGNGMGNRFKKLAQENRPSREYVRRVRALSQSVNVASKKALQKTVEAMVKAIEDVPTKQGKFEKRIGGTVRLTKNKDGRISLPFRPIIFGGDDVTFVCDGRLGISAAEKYLDYFSNEPLSEGPNATARAGIAIVKTHFPFAQAYTLAGALADSARTRIKDIERDAPGTAISAIDWHIATSGLVMNLHEIRQRDYTASDGNTLTMRPLRMDELDTDSRNQKQFGQVWYTLNDKSDEARNKVKALRGALREGESATKQFLELHKKKFETLQKVVGDGWVGGRSTLFDAVEALEFYVPLVPHMGAKR